MTLTTMLLRISVAILFGIIIGIERQFRLKNAGIRTNALVSLGSALFVILSVMIEGELSPARIPAQIISGIGFIGAGVIFKEGFSVSGLNTAATIWTTAAIGALSGYGYWLHGLVGTVAVLIVHIFFRSTHKYLKSENDNIALLYDIVIMCRADDEHHIRSLLHSAILSESIMLVFLSIEDTDQRDFIEIFARMRMPEKNVARLEHVMSRLSLEKTIKNNSL